jgi:hypothetical protein
LKPEVAALNANAVSAASRKIEATSEQRLDLSGWEKERSFSFGLSARTPTVIVACLATVLIFCAGFALGRRTRTLATD